MQYFALDFILFSGPTLSAIYKNTFLSFVKHICCLNNISQPHINLTT